MRKKKRDGIGRSIRRRFLSLFSLSLLFERPPRPKTSPGRQQGVLADLCDVIEHETPQTGIQGGVKDRPQSSDIGVVAAAKPGADCPRGIARCAAGSQLRGERLDRAQPRCGPCAREVSRRGGGEAAQGLEATG